MVARVQIPTEELPLWMRQARRGVDWGVVIVFAFSLLAVLPFIVQPSLPRTNASENYVFMAHDDAVAMREGRLYPRWSAHVLQGYGSPIPNFYPPGAPYSAAVLETLFTNNAVTAVRLLFILSLTLAGVMTYAFVMRIAGASAGILASVLYLYSPYVGQVAPYVLGDLPGVLALGLLPTLLWSVHRLLSLNVRFDFTLVILISAALILTEPRTALIGFMLTFLTAASFGWRYKNRIGWMLLALSVGGCLPSFFWLPAVAERNEVHWQASSIVPQL
ncbi:MAG: glycosyltransferase family 39 protein, partial [Chitinophagaceae bacterium]|nr:glycosyltransferase family 39 protein [Anaerolineae bacterium]